MLFESLYPASHVLVFFLCQVINMLLKTAFKATFKVASVWNRSQQGDTLILILEYSSSERWSDVLQVTLLMKIRVNITFTCSGFFINIQPNKRSGCFHGNVFWHKQCRTQRRINLAPEIHEVIVINHKGQRAQSYLQVELTSNFLLKDLDHNCKLKD